MYYDESSHHRTATAQRSHILDTIRNCGPMAANVLAAEERHRDAARQAVIWAATHDAGARKRGVWRYRLGTLLIRAGNRLQGAAPTPTMEMTGAAN